MTKRCMVCGSCRDESESRCPSCDIPLYDTSATPAIQGIQLAMVHAVVHRRYANLVRGLGPAKIIRPESLPNFSMGHIAIPGLVRKLFGWIFSPLKPRGREAWR